MLARATLLTALFLSVFAQRGFSQAPKWEYAQFTAVGEIGFLWEAGDSTVLTQPTRDRDPGLPDKSGPKVVRQMSARLGELNRIGADGWELVSVQSQGSTSVYLFKRGKA